MMQDALVLLALLGQVEGFESQAGQDVWQRVNDIFSTLDSLSFLTYENTQAALQVARRVKALEWWAYAITFLLVFGFGWSVGGRLFASPYRTPSWG